MPKVGIVIPHHLPTLDFLEEWKTEFDNSDVHIMIIEDKPTNQTKIPVWLNKQNSSLYTHADIDKELGKNSWIIPRETSAIRSFGLYKMWQQKPDMIVTLDNDCFPDGSQFITGHWQALQTTSTLDWVKSTPAGFMDDMYSRGFPYNVRRNTKTYVNHGLWSNIPDLDAAQMLLQPEYRTLPLAPQDSITIPRNNFYPMCGMNLAFRPEVTPLMYFGLFGKDYGFDQFDDIWAGVFSKKVMDHLSWAVRSGYPSVEHRKQSDALTNFEKQAGGMKYNEKVWRVVQLVELGELTSAVDCYRKIIDEVYNVMHDAYWKKVARATNVWLDLYE